ncbi:unnamed protein product, partial [Linum tenue]
ERRNPGSPQRAKDLLISDQNIRRFGLKVKGLNKIHFSIHEVGWWTPTPT